MIAAGLDVVRDGGIEALTFRAVAERADVPLGSTSYHFADKTELLIAVSQLARTRNLGEVASRLETAVAEHGVAAGLAHLIAWLTTDWHGELVLEHDLFLSALREPALREESRRWSADFVEVIERYVEPGAAAALGYLIDGVCVQSAVFDIAFPAHEVEPLIHRTIGATPAS